MSISIILLVLANLLLLAVLLALPLGVRTVTVRQVIAAPAGRVWNALFPFGTDWGWSSEILGLRKLDETSGWQQIYWRGRDDQPVERCFVLSDVVEGQQFKLRVAEDTVLEQGFWNNYVEGVKLTADGDGRTLVELSRTDKYRGAAFMLVRYFGLRREIANLRSWAETGAVKPVRFKFEHPLVQLGSAVVSLLLLWPLLGFNTAGFLAATTLTVVIALHELGHVLAFRIMGHRQSRMIFIPLLGGLAVGGRPYDRQYEVAFVALMGPGLSAALVGLAVTIAVYAAEQGLAALSLAASVFAGAMALFNLANLLPFWRLDGSQVLRQICASPLARSVGAFLVLAPLLLLGAAFDFTLQQLAMSAIAGLGLAAIPAGRGGRARLRYALKPISQSERVLMAAGLAAVACLHCLGIYWATSKIL